MSYTTSRGVTLDFVGIAPMLDKLRVTFAIPTPPQYAVKTLQGNTELHDHDETTLQTDDDRAMWANYLKEKTEAERRYNQALMRLLLLRGVRVDMAEGWEAEHTYLGFVVPTDPIEKKMHWLETEVLGTVQDYEAVMLGVLEASGVSEEVLTQIGESFRYSVARTEIKRPQTAGTQGMELQRPVRTGARGGAHANAAKSVRRARSRR